MTEPKYTIDVELLQSELDWLMAHPERHRQAHFYYNSNWEINEEGSYDVPPVEQLVESAEWKCNTTACLAGWTALHAGYVPIGMSLMMVPSTDPDGERRAVDDLAASLLGLDYDQAARLFLHSDSLWLLYVYSAEMTDGAIQIPDRDYFDHAGRSMGTWPGWEQG
jgi:hypothetical protein